MSTPAVDRSPGSADAAPDAKWDAELVPDARGRTVRPSPDCPVEVALAAISGRWATLVLRELMHGPRSFGELRDRLPGLTAKVLTERLRDLEARRLVARTAVAAFPVRTQYALTPAGTALRPLLLELYRTGAALLDARA
ncbi:winged helix-turn-helix transcriptional regulator [Yinghuangia sp. YIM S09857]|uniref:winged helix-turn-helix transcriptional regulator n=1 Tax=Yinghuangia sp. YIM S09857 TaxID=3436929 RepID=UPI003F53A78A